jgi:hypothetical protein
MFSKEQVRVCGAAGASFGQAQHSFDILSRYLGGLKQFFRIHLV